VGRGLLGLALACGSASAQSLRGTVVAVQDGDSLTLRADQASLSIRLAEIDAPERDQPWASDAKQALSEKVLGAQVTLEVIDTDSYGRLVARVRRGDRDINRELVREGHAWVYRQYLRDETLLAVEAAAREERAGLWALPAAERTPPWEWRHRAPGASRRAQPVVSPEAEDAFRCQGKRTCREMRSCAEARFYQGRCGVTRLDGDGDGTPCEALCR